MNLQIMPYWVFKKFIILIILLQFEHVNSQNRLINQQFSSKHLNENRIINIYLPDDYYVSEDNYPVLYLLDGEYIFDFAKGSVDFLSNEFGFMPKLIIVSIPNTDRLRDLNVTYDKADGYNNFLLFLELELQPFIIQNFRTNHFNILYGWSTASSVCTYLLGINSNMFKAYIETGSGIGQKTVNFLKNKIPTSNYSNTFLYANTEKNLGREKHLLAYKSILDSINPNELNYKFNFLNDSHVGTMSKGLYDGLKHIFNSYYIPESEIEKGGKAVVSYYKSLEYIYGYEIKIPLGAFVECASSLYQNKSHEAIWLLKYGLTIYPNATELYAVIAEIYEYMNEIDLAKTYYNSAFLNAKNNSIEKLKYNVLSKKFNKQKIENHND